MTTKKKTPSPRANETRRKRRAAASMIERRKCANRRRRARLEAAPADWLRYYLHAAFPLPFGEVHLRMIDAAARAVETGSGMACAAPRGTGKSTVLSGIALWAVLSGRCRFPIVAGWAHAAARRMLRKWVATLAENPRIQADYPEATGPFEESTHANRLKHIVWEDTGEPTGADVQTGSGTVVLPGGLGALGAVSISGNTRGLSIGLPDGSTARPDVLFLDDPQSKEVAESPKLTRQTVEKIEGDLFSVAGPDSRLAVMCACTVVADGDVATHFLTHPDFEGVRVGQVVRWPDGWKDGDSPARALWDEWNKERVAGLANHDGGKAARGFYKAHAADMTAGMEVSWPERYDKKRGDPDAMFAAMWDFYRLGERAFYAERQNEPLASGEASVFELPQNQVAGKVNGLARRVAGENAVGLVGMVDLNADGARWAVAACTNSAALAVVDYGVFPGGGRMLVEPGESEAVGLMRGLSGLDAALQAVAVMRGETRMPLDVVLLDCGWQMQTVFDWLAGAGRVSPLPWCASRGWGSRNYRPTGKTVIGRPGDGWHVADWQRKGRVLVHDADGWRLRQQKGWLLPIGAPESLCFFGSPGTRHEHFADGVVCERLIAHAQTDAGPLYKWQLTPGLRNDWGDVATGLCVAASRLGISPTGVRAVPPVRARRKVYRQADMRWVPLGGGQSASSRQIVRVGGENGKSGVVIGRPGRW